LVGLIGALVADSSLASGFGLVGRLHALTDTVIAGLHPLGGVAVSPLNILDAIAPLAVAARGRAGSTLRHLLSGPAGKVDMLSETEGLLMALA
jgi:hypothetical protein